MSAVNETDITTHFTIEEFERSEQAKNMRIDNVLPARFLKNVNRLCTYVLEPLRGMVGCPITITSGYRCKTLNEAIGGADNSQHMTGQAADIQCEDMKLLVAIICKKWVNFDQAIIYDTFVHVSYINGISNRNQLIDKRTK